MVAKSLPRKVNKIEDERLLEISLAGQNFAGNINNRRVRHASLRWPPPALTKRAELTTRCRYLAGTGEGADAASVAPRSEAAVNEVSDYARRLCFNWMGGVVRFG